MTLLIFIFILSTLIFVHELGHFLVAKKNGIRVEEFGLGLPPRIVGKKVGETIYSINWLPFGGFVKLTGEDVPDDKSKKEALKDPKSFLAKSPLQRIAVLVAGVVMNLFLAVILFYVLIVSNGYRSFYFPLFFDYDFRFGNEHKIATVVSGLMEGSAADDSGINYGEAILEIDGVKVTDVEDVRREVSGKLNEQVEVVLVDLSTGGLGEERAVTLVPEPDENGEAVLGVYLSSAVYLSYDSLMQKAFSGVLHSYNVLTYSVSTMGGIIRTSFETKDLSPVSSTVAGPVGIYNIVGGILQYAGGKVFLNLIDYTALMSLSLAFINIFPFPALDGGRILFVLFEFVRGKRMNPEIESKIHRFGMIILLALLALVTIKDFTL
jgi:regulator of sigma E protease